MNPVFDAYSAYYDLLYRDKDYVGESNYVIDLIQQCIPGANSILELGCGTGGHAENFARAGFQVQGIDLSESMLACAEQRRMGLPADLADNLDFKHADVREYRCNKTFDVVLSLFHVFSYQTSNVDLIATFATAASHLAPGGILIFDYWYGPGVLTQLPEPRNKILEDECFRVERKAKPIVVPGENRVEVYYTVHVVDKKRDRHNILSECHNMRYLFLPELELMSAPFFKIKNHFAWETYRIPAFDDWSAVSIMEKQR